MDSTPARIGRFQILNRIGEGGMGVLYLARDSAIGRLVAIKLLREGYDDADRRERFVREAQAAGGLGHINIVTIFDIGEHEGQPFIAMEYIPGETLARIVSRQAPLPVRQKLEWIEELCAGMAHAHKGGIVHRDIKPANLMVDPEGVLKILDFGIARLGGGSGTRTGTVLGTLNYMSPEQLSGESVDHRSDVFSVGAVSYELLSYRPAFPGTLFDGLYAKIQFQPPEPLDSLALPADLLPILWRALEKDRDKRYQDLGVMRREVARIRLRLEATEETPEDRPEPDAEPTVSIGTRIRQVHGYVESGRRSLAQSDYPAALHAAQMALSLDSTSDAARSLADESQKAIEKRRLAGMLRDAEDAVGRGDATAASRLLSLLEDVDVRSPEVAFLRQAVETLRQEREKARQREDAFLAMFDHARRRIEENALDAALRALDAALALQPGHIEATALRAQVAADLQAGRAQETIDTGAQEAVASAEQLFASGDEDGAERLLVGFEPPHPAVATALSALRERRAAVERQRLDEQARRQADASRLEEADACAAAAEQALASGDLRSAQHALAQLESLAVDHPRAQALRAACADAQQRQAAATAAAAARRQIDANLSRAVAAIDARRWGEAQSLIDAALAVDPRDQDALVWLRRLGEARSRDDEEARARAQQVAIRVRDAQAAIDLGDLDRARQCLEQAAALDPRAPELDALQRVIIERRAVAEALAQKIEARLDRAAKLLAIGKLQKAEEQIVEVLQLQPDNPQARSLSVTLAEAAADIERLRREQQESEERVRRQKQEAEERARREKEEAEERAKAVKEALRAARRESSPERALGFVRQALEIEPGRADALKLAAKFERAVAEMRERAEGTAPVTSQEAATAAPEVDTVAAAALTPSRKWIAAVAAGLAALGVLAIVWIALKPKPPEPPPQKQEQGTVTPPETTTTQQLPLTEPQVPPLTPPETPGVQPPQMVLVSLDVQPWANVRIVPAGPAGTPAAPGNYTTPVSLELAVGEYDLYLENRGMNPPMTKRVRVDAGKQNSFRLTMPGFDPNAVVTTLLGPERR